jgi:hypothetical protein
LSRAEAWRAKSSNTQRWNEDRMVIVGFEDKALLPKLRNEVKHTALQSSG